MIKCNNCNSTNVSKLIPYDFGKDPETGVVDVGNMRRCFECGMIAEDDNFIVIEEEDSAE